MIKTLPKLTFVASAFFLLGLIIGCDGGSSSSEANGGDSTATTDAEPMASSPSMEEKTVYCLYDRASVRQEPKGKGKWLTGMNLGEKVTFTGKTAVDSASDNRAYVQVRLSDGTEGWAQENIMLMEGEIAVSLNEVRIFQRPDLVATTDKSIPRRTIVGLTNKNEENWMEVSGIPAGETWYTSGWTKSPNVSYEEEDLAAALLLNRAIEEKDEEKQIEALQNVVSTFPNSVFAVDASELIAELEMAEEPMMDEEEMMDEEMEEGAM